MNRNFRFVGKMEGEGICLCFMIRGNSYYDCENLKQKEMKQNTNNIFMFKDVASPHCVVKDQEIEFFEIVIPPSYVETLSHLYPQTMEPLLKKVNEGKVFELGDKHFDTTIQMIQVINQIENSAMMGNCSSMYIEAKIQELIAMQMHQFRNPQELNCNNCILKHRDKIEEARLLLEKQYKKPPSIHELALQVGANDTLLKNGFKQLYNNTVYGYLFEYRMEIARKLLSLTQETIAEIAEKSGYEHQSHFSTAFKRRYGVSPLEYRIN